MFYSFCVVVVDNVGLQNLMSSSSLTPKKCSSFAISSISPPGQKMSKELIFNNSGIFPSSAAFRNVLVQPYVTKAKRFTATANLLANSSTSYPVPSDNVLNVVVRFLQQS